MNRCLSYEKESSFYSCKCIFLWESSLKFVKNKNTIILTMYLRKEPNFNSERAFASPFLNMENVWELSCVFHKKAMHNRSNVCKKDSYNIFKAQMHNIKKKSLTPSSWHWLKHWRSWKAIHRFSIPFKKGRVLILSYRLSFTYWRTKIPALSVSWK